MDNPNVITYPGNESIVIYQSEDNALRLDVQLSNETVWLTQKQMAMLFDTTPQNITVHIGNIYKEVELLKDATCKDFLQVQIEGGREIRRVAKFYDLDVIISVGYRVKSKRGTQFRQWANKVLKDYLLQGYVISRRFEKLEQRVAKTEEQIENIVRTSLPPREGIFVDGQIYDAFDFVKKLIGNAKHSIMLIDNYTDESVLTMMASKQQDVKIEIFTRTIDAALRQAAEKFNKQYGALQIHEAKNIHDRFLIIDDKEIYLIGASLKDLGRKLFAFSRMESKQIDLLKQYLAAK